MTLTPVMLPRYRKLPGEFSREKKVALKEVMEGALVEYLMKYGFKREVEALLRNQ
jgi:hypothetical protein